MELKLDINESKVSDAEKIEALTKFDYKCQFCGFEAKRFQEVTKVDGEAVVACSFCYQTLNLAACASRRAGYLIYLPEITQAKLNNILRAIYVARSDANPKIADKARRLFDVLTSRRKVANDILGTDDPKVLSSIMGSFMTSEEKEQISSKLPGIRLFSIDKKIEIEDGMEFNEFPQMLNFWKNEVDFLNQPCSSWKVVEDTVEEVIEKPLEENVVPEENAEKVEEDGE